MKIYTVTHRSTVDCYKRPETYTKNLGAYKDMDEAYSVASGKLHSLLNDYEAFEDETTKEEYKVFMDIAPDNQSHYEYLCQLGETTFEPEFVQDLVEEVMVDTTLLT